MTWKFFPTELSEKSAASYQFQSPLPMAMADDDRWLWVGLFLLCRGHWSLEFWSQLLIISLFRKRIWPPFAAVIIKKSPTPWNPSCQGVLECRISIKKSHYPGIRVVTLYNSVPSTSWKAIVLGTELSACTWVTHHHHSLKLFCRVFSLIQLYVSSPSSQRP